MKATVLVGCAAIMTVSCSKSTPPPPTSNPSQAAQIASLQSEVSEMRAELTTLQQIVESPTAKPTPSTAGAELQVRDGAQSYSRVYPTAEACEEAKKAALAENDVREANRVADNAKHPNFTEMTIVAVSAYCLPRD